MILVLITGCKSATVNSSTYNGKKLIIGVIGDVPVVREENVTFKNIGFIDMRTSESLPSELDAVFIMKEHLIEASKPNYARVYKNSSIPFFFI